LARTENTIILPTDPIKVGEKVDEAMSFFNDSKRAKKQQLVFNENKSHDK
jgi:hypothetical protein